MAEIPEELRRAVWKRDKHRCRECGVAVAQQRGCLPQTHHITREAAGGSTDMENLATLCYVCHATKPSLGHQKLFVAAANDPNLLPQFIKWAVWDLALNLAGYSEWMSPLRFPAAQILRDLEGWKKQIELAIEWTKEVVESHPKCVCDDEQEFKGQTSPEDFDAVMTGIRTGWYGHVAERFFREQLG